MKGIGCRCFFFLWLLIMPALAHASDTLLLYWSNHLGFKLDFSQVTAINIADNLLYVDGGNEHIVALPNFKVGTSLVTAFKKMPVFFETGIFFSRNSLAHNIRSLGIPPGERFFKPSIHFYKIGASVQFGCNLFQSKQWLLAAGTGIDLSGVLAQSLRSDYLTPKAIRSQNDSTIAFLYPNYVRTGLCVAIPFSFRIQFKLPKAPVYIGAVAGYTLGLTPLVTSGLLFEDNGGHWDNNTSLFKGDSFYAGLIISYAAYKKPLSRKNKVYSRKTTAYGEIDK